MHALVAAYRTGKSRAATARTARLMDSLCCSTSGRGFSEWPTMESEEATGEDDIVAGTARAATPWVRSVIVGAPLMRNPKYNKGLAFSEEERDKLYLRGLMPPAIMSQEVQMERVLRNLNDMHTPFEQYNYLSSLQDRNERLFFRVVTDHLDRLIHIVHEPTMGRACLRYGLMFKNLPRGLFISLKDRGLVRRIYKNWPERRVRALAITDGENVLGLGDLGIQGMGSSVSTLTCYTSCAGVLPHFTLPVSLDAGCDNEDLLRSPFYVGLKRKRDRSDAVHMLWDEVITSAQRRYGNSVLVHLHHMEPSTSEKIIARHRSSAAIFSDELQAFPAAVLAGLLAAAPMTDRVLSDHRFMLVGDGDLPAHVAEMISYYLARAKGLPAAAVRRQIFLVDSKGLVNRDRANELTEMQLLYANQEDSATTLSDAVRTLKPSVLVGCSSKSAEGSPLMFTRDVCKEMADLNRRPVIMPLSQPAPDALPQNVYRWTDGRAIYAGREQWESTGHDSDGKGLRPRPCLSAYIFPGVALGCLAAGAVRVPQDMFLAAAEAVAEQVTEEDRKEGSVYPCLKRARAFSAEAGRRVAEIAYKSNIATNLPKPTNLMGFVESVMYDTRYRPYR